MQTSSRGEALLIGEEGIVLHEYRDHAGYWTLGIGHLLHESDRKSGAVLLAGKPMPFRPSITKDQALALLHQDLGWAERAIAQLVKPTLSQNEFDALASFTFNIGAGPKGLAGSTLLRKLNAGDQQSVPDQMRRWIRSGGKIDPVLERRREREILLWRTA